MFRVAACTCPSARKGSETQGGDTEGDAEEGADAIGLPIAGFRDI